MNEVPALCRVASVPYALISSGCFFGSSIARYMTSNSLAVRNEGTNRALIYHRKNVDLQELC